MQSLITTNKNFTYRSDPKEGKQDMWTVHDNRKPFQGDCEDYALALAYEISGYNKLALVKNILTGKLKMWYCHTGNNGHAVLEYKNQFAECIYKKWITSKDALPPMGIYPKYKYSVSQIAYKLIFAFLRKK